MTQRYRVWEIREMFLDAEDADEAQDIFANDPEGGNTEMGVEYMGESNYWTAPKSKLMHDIGTKLGIPLFEPDQPNTLALIHEAGIKHLKSL